MILMGILGSLFLLAIFLYFGFKLLDYIDDVFKERALNGEFDRFRIVDNDGKYFKIEHSYGTWRPQWKRLPYTDTHYDIDDAKKELAHIAKKRAQEVATDKATREERFQDSKTRKEILKENKKLTKGVSLTSIKQVIPEEWV